MKTATQAFAIHIADANGESTERIVSIDVPVRWDEMIDEWVLTEEAQVMIDKRKAQELGLLTPAQLRELRERHRQNQKQMGTLFQVGEKSWSRWESGKHRPTRSINLLIRALYDGEISINYLRKKAGMKVDPETSASEAFRKRILCRPRTTSSLRSCLAGQRQSYVAFISRSSMNNESAKGRKISFGPELLSAMNSLTKNIESPGPNFSGKIGAANCQPELTGDSLFVTGSKRHPVWQSALSDGELLIV
jgi:DNA-binding transcriptional regulator YiaG